MEWGWHGGVTHWGADGQRKAGCVGLRSVPDTFIPPDPDSTILTQPDPYSSVVPNVYRNLLEFQIVN